MPLAALDRTFQVRSAFLRSGSHVPRSTFHLDRTFRPQPGEGLAREAWQGRSSLVLRKPLLGRLGAILGPLGAILGPLGAILGLSWGLLGAIKGVAEKVEQMGLSARLFLLPLGGPLGSLSGPSAFQVGTPFRVRS